MSYKISNNPLSSVPSGVITERGDTNLLIPLSTGNADCARFLLEWKSGVAIVTDADDQTVAYSDDAVRALGLTPL